MNRPRYNRSAVESTPEQEAAVAPYEEAEVPIAIARDHLVLYGGQDESFIASLPDREADLLWRAKFFPTWVLDMWLVMWENDLKERNNNNNAAAAADEIKAAVAPFDPALRRKCGLGMMKDQLVDYAHQDRAYLDGLGRWTVVNLWTAKFSPNGRA
jgi:hypothetical protein